MRRLAQNPGLILGGEPAALSSLWDLGPATIQLLDLAHVALNLSPTSAVHSNNERLQPGSLFGVPVELSWIFHPAEAFFAAVETAGLTPLERIIRGPCAEAEHPSRRAYVLAKVGTRPRIVSPGQHATLLLMIGDVVTTLKPILLPALQSDWGRRATQLSAAFGATLLVAQTVQELAKAVTEVKRAVDALRGPSTPDRS